MELKRLKSDVIDKTRSSSTLHTVCQCVLELVLNSLDAKATSIAIRINLVTLRIQVVDNGEGISRSNMHLIGNRYFTNKCNNLEDLQSIKYYGFRGEALANLTDLAKYVMVTSKYVSSCETVSKTLGKSSDVIIDKNRPSNGTTVTVEGLFDNFPVRKKRIVKELEMDDIKRNIKALIIINPGIIFSLRDDVSGELLLSNHRAEDIPSAFKALHPEKQNGTVIKISKRNVKITALLFKKYTENKQTQYLYINKRPIYSPIIQKLINKMFHKNTKCSKKMLDYKKNHPAYVINIKIPYSDVDILINPTKTMAEFKNWERIEHCIQKLFNYFFGNKEIENKIEEKVKENISCGISQLNGAVYAFGYKRKRIDAPETDNDIKSILKNSGKHKSDVYNFKEPKEKALKRCKNTQKTENIFSDDIIESSVPKEAFKHPFYKPLSLPHTNLSISKFTNDENKGKDLIMDMFLKSTQVYTSDEDLNNEVYSQGSGETIYAEESNFVMENNVKTNHKSQSMSINVRSTKKIKMHKKLMLEKSVQASLSNNEMVSKGLQTTLESNKPDLIINQDNPETNSPYKDYTVLFKNESNFKFVHKKPQIQKDFKFTYSDNCFNCDFNTFKFPKENFDKKPHKSNKSKLKLLQHKFPNENNLSHNNNRNKTTYNFFDNVNVNKKPINYNKAMDYKSPYFKLSEQKTDFRLTLDTLQDDNIDENNFWEPTLESFNQFNPIVKSTQKSLNIQNNDFTTKCSNNFKSIFNEDSTLKKIFSQRSDEDKIKEINKENKDVFENELASEKSALMKEFFDWNSQFTYDENYNGDWTRREFFGSNYYLNKKTGFTTHSIPKAVNKFDMEERYEFLPKGMSPIINEAKSVNESLSQNGKNTLFEYIFETYKNDLLFVKWQHYLKDIDPKTFFENIYTEKLNMCHTNIPIIKSINKQSSIISLNRDLFNNFKVIGQLDRKFIIVKEVKENLLLVFDQHAVHERIRLEKLLKIYKNAKSTCKEKLMYFMPQNDLSLLKSHDNYLQHIGITVEFFTNGIYVTEVPLCLQFKLKDEDSSKSLNKVVNVLINEIISLLKSTRGVSLKRLPTLIQNVINLEACRGAIKFGDVLNHQKCTELLTQLSTTELPFQCAHGRPTVTPLINLNNSNTI